MELATQVNRIEDSLERLAAFQATFAEAQVRTDARVERLAEAQARTEVHLGKLAEAQARSETQLERLTGSLAQLAEAQARTELRVGQLAEAQGRTEARVEQLAEAQARTETRLEQLTAALGRLADAQTQTEVQLRALRNWQAGEDGRRKGERLERQVLLRAHWLLHGGEGGTAAEAETRRRLGALLAPLLGDDVPRPEEDPFLADVIWWKGDRVAVVEVSSVVDEHDVDRVAARAETLRRAGVSAVPIVIGDAWDHGETRIEAEIRHVEWKVGPDLSEGFIAFRRLPP